MKVIYIEHAEDLNTGEYKTYEHFDEMTVAQYLREIDYLTDLRDRAIINYIAERKIVNGKDIATIEIWS